MATQILVKKSGDAGNTPEAVELSHGELALNYADGKLFYKNTSDEIKAFSIDLAGDVTGEQRANTIADTTVTGKLLTNYNSTIGVVDDKDTILSAIGKLDGNFALKQPLDADLTAIASITDNTGILKKTSETTWSLDTTNDIVNTPFTVKAVSQGAYSDGTVIAAGTRLEDIIKNMLQTVVPAVYTQPTLTISTVTALAQEFGTNISAILNSTFVQNDAGPVTEHRVKRGQDIVQTEEAVTPYTAAFQLLANTAFISEVDYSVGPQKYNNMGIADGDPIPEGIKTSNTINFVSQRKTFWGADTSTTAATTSSQIRVLASSALGHSNGSTFTINIPPGTRRITFAYPANLRVPTSVNYVQIGNVPVLDTFTIDEVSPKFINVEGANGAASVSYRVYTYIASEPFISAATYNVVI